MYASKVSSPTSALPLPPPEASDQLSYRFKKRNWKQRFVFALGQKRISVQKLGAALLWRGYPSRQTSAGHKINPVRACSRRITRRLKTFERSASAGSCSR